MNPLTIKLPLCLLTLTLCACAPSGESSQSANAPEIVTNNNQISSVSTLEAASDFDFRSDKDITFSFAGFPSDAGKINIYYHYDFHDVVNDIYYPDHRTKLASFVAIPDDSYRMQVLKDWEHLVFEWLPMDGKSNEQYMLLRLSDTDHYALNF